jgi:hypothetical protein
MSLKPSYPLIIISDDWVIENYHYHENTNENYLVQTSALDQMLCPIRTAYDCNNIKWSYEIKTKQVFPNTWWNRLRYKIHNKPLQGEEVWTKISDYHLDDLKAHLYICIDNDDDVLTQFVEADEFKTKIKDCTIFIAIFDTLEKYIWGTDDYLDEIE